jgi:hypothetical protein
MYYVHATYPLDTGRADIQARWKAIITAAESSSLAPAVRGLAYADFQLGGVPFIGFRKISDRGEELQKAWVRNGHEQFRGIGVASLAQATLKRWRLDLSRAKRPAVIFNASAVETGKRFTFSTSHMDMERKEIAQGQDDFDLSYPATDIPIATAVRLSASFPYVSPAARPDLRKHVLGPFPRGAENLHLVDGGYFDNSGLVALSTWLDSGLQDDASQRPEQVPRKILVIQILPFPYSKMGAVPYESGPFFQALAPIETLLTVRNEVQAGFSQRDFSFCRSVGSLIETILSVSSLSILNFQTRARKPLLRYLGICGNATKMRSRQGGRSGSASTKVAN